MKRESIYLIWRVLHYRVTSLIFCLLYAYLGTSVSKSLFQSETMETIALISWVAIGLFTIFHIGRIGQNIDAEKKLFETWRNIVKSDIASMKQKEWAAEEILQSKDINEVSLKEIIDHLSDSSPNRDEALEKFYELKKLRKKENNNEG